MIDLWPSRPAFAGDIGVGRKLVNVWKHRGSIPPEFWAAIERAARQRGIAGATASDLASAAARRRVVAPAGEAA